MPHTSFCLTPRWHYAYMHAFTDQRGKRNSEDVNCGPSPMKVKYNDEGMPSSCWTPTNTYNCDMLFEDDSDAWDWNAKIRYNLKFV